MSKKKVTKSDLDKTLRELGFKEGDEIILPSKKSTSNEQSNEGDEDEDGGIEVPKKPPPPQP